MLCPYLHLLNLDIDLKTRKANAKEGAPKPLGFREVITCQAKYFLIVRIKLKKVINWPNYVQIMISSRRLLGT